MAIIIQAAIVLRNKNIFIMKYVYRPKLVKLVCQKCGRVFYAENGVCYCPECEWYWIWG